MKDLSIFINNRGVLEDCGRSYAAVRAIRKSDGAVAIFVCDGSGTNSYCFHTAEEKARTAGFEPLPDYEK